MRPTLEPIRFIDRIAVLAPSHLRAPGTAAEPALELLAERRRLSGQMLLPADPSPRLIEVLSSMARCCGLVARPDGVLPAMVDCDCSICG